MRNATGNESVPVRGSVLRPPDLGRGHVYEELTLARVRELAQGKTFALADPPRNSRGLLELVHRKTGLAFVVIPGGEFLMGSREKSEEGPPRRVAIKPFLLGRTECTQEAWLAGGGREPLAVPGPGHADGQRLVVVRSQVVPGRRPLEAPDRGRVGGRLPWGDDDAVLLRRCRERDAGLRERRGRVPEGASARRRARAPSRSGSSAWGSRTRYAGPAAAGALRPESWGPPRCARQPLGARDGLLAGEATRGPRGTAPRSWSAVRRSAPPRGGCWAESAEYARSAIAHGGRRRCGARDARFPARRGPRVTGVAGRARAGAERGRQGAEPLTRERRRAHGSRS